MDRLLSRLAEQIDKWDPPIPRWTNKPPRPHSEITPYTDNPVLLRKNFAQITIDAIIKYALESQQAKQIPQKLLSFPAQGFQDFLTSRNEYKNLAAALKKQNLFFTAISEWLTLVEFDPRWHENIYDTSLPEGTRVFILVPPAQTLSGVIPREYRAVVISENSIVQRARDIIREHSEAELR